MRQIMTGMIAIALLGACKVQVGANTLKDDAIPPAVQAVYQKCLACHQKPETLIHEDLRKLETLQLVTPWMSATQLATMITHAKLEPADKEQFTNYVSALQSRLPLAPGGSLQQCIKPPEANFQLNAASVDGASSPMAQALSQALSQNAVTFYSESSMRKVWQSATATNGFFDKEGTALAATMTAERRPNTFHDQELGYFAVGPLEFPWAHSAGMDLTPETETVKFVIQPQSSPLAETTIRNRDNSPEYFEGVTTTNIKGPQLGWDFQPGAMFGEAIYKRVGENPILWEIRLRRLLQRVEEKSLWKMDVLRYFANQDDFEQARANFCGQNNNQPGCNNTPGSHPTVRLDSIMNAGAVLAAEQRQRPQILHSPFDLNSLAPKVLQPEAPVPSVDGVGPDFYAKLVADRKLISVFGSRWQQPDQGAAPAWAPLATTADSFLPQNYLGAFLPLTMQGCMSCHSSAGKHVNQFDPEQPTTVKPAPQDGQIEGGGGVVDASMRPARTWYHFIQGNDTVFSYHPLNDGAVAQKTNLVASGSGTLNDQAVERCKLGDSSPPPAGNSPTTTLPNQPTPPPVPQDSTPSTDPQLVAQGQRIWDQSCATAGCHTSKKDRATWLSLARNPAAADGTMSEVLDRLKLDPGQIDAVGAFLPDGI